MSDGSIRVDTGLNNEPLKGDVGEANAIIDKAGNNIANDVQGAAQKIEKAVQNSADNIKKTFEDIKFVPDGSEKSLEKLIEMTAKKAAEAKDELAKVTEEIKKWQEQAASDLQGANPDQANNYFEMFGSELEEAKQKQAELNEKIKEYEDDIRAATEEIKRLKEAEAEAANIDMSGKELTSAVKDQDFLSKIQGEQEYQAVLAETESRMQMIAAEAEKIAQKNGLAKSQVLQTNKEYSELARKQQLLVDNADRYKKKTAEGKNEAKKLERNLSAAKKQSNGFGNSISAGIKKLGKMALAVVGVRAAYSLVKKAADAYLEQNEETKQQLESIWTVAGEAIGPVVETIVKWITTALSYVNALVKALSGIDFIANANAKALKKQEKAASGAAKANRQLAGFDEMTKLSDNSSSSSSSDSNNALTFKTDVDTSEFEKHVQQAMTKVKSWLKDVASYLVSTYRPTIESSIESWQKISEHSGEALEKMGASISKLWDESLAPFAVYIGDEWVPGIVNSFSENLAPIITDVLCGAIDILGDTFEFVCEQIQNLTDDILLPAFQLIGDIWDDMCSGLKDSWDEYGGAIMDGIREFVDGIFDIFNDLYDNILKPIIDKIWNVLQELWDNHLKPLWDNLVSFIGEVCAFILMLWNKYLKPLVDFVVATVGPIIVNVVNRIFEIVGHVFGAIGDMIGGVILALQGVIKFLRGIFSGDMKTAMNGLIDLANGLVGCIWGAIRGLINLIIDGVNALWGIIYGAIAGIINGVGSIVKGLGSIFGQDWGWEMPSEPPLIPALTWDIPKIPYLALGGIVNVPNKGVTATIGEAGAEAVLPLENNTEWMDVLADKIGRTITIPINLDGKRIATYIVDVQKKRAFALNGV